MAFPSIGGVRPDNLSGAWDRARSIAGEIKARTTTVRSMAVNGTSSGVILDHCSFLADMKQELLVIAAIPGIGAYAQAQINDVTFDVAASFMTMLATIDNLAVWVFANFPKDVNGYLLAKTFLDNSARQVDRQFDASLLAGYVTLLDAISASIE